MSPPMLITWPASSPDLTLLYYLLSGHMKNLVYETPVDSEEDLLAWVMTAVDVGLQGIGDWMYENMVCRYLVCVEVASRHIELFLLVNPEEQQHTVSSRSGWVQHVMWRGFCCNGKNGWNGTFPEMSSYAKPWSPLQALRVCNGNLDSSWIWDFRACQHQRSFIGACNEWLWWPVISRNVWGLSFPDICLTAEERPQKKPQWGKLTWPGIEPRPAR